MKKEFKNLTEWFLWFPGQAVLNKFCGDRLPYRLAVLWGRIQFLCSKTRVRVLRYELFKSTGTAALDTSVRDEVILRSMQLDAMDQLEILSYPRLGRHVKGKRLALETIPLISGIEHLDKALSLGGVILAHLHFGAMQMVLPALAHRGYPLSQVGNSRLEVFYDPAKRRSPLLEATLKKQKRFEESLPVRFFYTGEDTRAIVKWLKDGKIVDLAIDGRAGRKWIKTQFLGRPAQFADNSFRLAQLTNASFLPTFIVRQPDLRLRVVIEAPIRPTEDDHAISYELMLRQFLDLAERYFEAYPCHYCRRLWVMHRQKPHLTHPLFNDGP